MARLVAGGATNREIAAALTIAPKTVAAHIEHILAKLGATRRTQIASWVVTRQSAVTGSSGARHRTRPAPVTETAIGCGRFAPSPSGDLHVGNLRTALLAWLFARSTGRRFVVRMEDLDRVRAGASDRQLADLAAIGLDWDGRSPGSRPAPDATTTLSSGSSPTA